VVISVWPHVMHLFTKRKSIYDVHTDGEGEFSQNRGRVKAIMTSTVKIIFRVLLHFTR